MTELAVNTRWIFAVVKLSLLYATLLQDHFCEALCTKTGTRKKNILFISPQNITFNTTFPTDAVYINENGNRLCFNLQQNNTGCCLSKDFDCSPKISLVGDCYRLTLSEAALRNQDVVVLQNPTYNFSCMPSTFYNSKGLMLNIHNCLKMGGLTIRLGLDQLFGNSTSEKLICEDTWPKFRIKSCRNNKETTTASWSTISNLVSLTTNVTSSPTNNSISMGIAQSEGQETSPKISNLSSSFAQTTHLVILPL
ncbi:uncharacterized protein LOC114134447 [Xiphophorus couchianus]|uniref:uncharacterized protein LOC114134447 n=1 Tax=Xiphophorus couchianus TaxID=32473 RepID=UPI0010168B7E|nr:uncharacterized protein LOC114134447 [Xiphophorus couchianus]